MTDEFQEMRRDISTFFVSLRNSIDRPYRPYTRDRHIEREQFLRPMLLVEEARLRFNSYVRYRERPSAREWVDIRNDLESFADNFLNSKDIDPEIFNRPFRVYRTISSENNIISFFAPLKDSVSVGDALNYFRKNISRINYDIAVQTTMNLGELARIIPNQQVAPAQFDIVNNKIVVSKQSPKKRPEEQNNVSAALEHIKQSGKSLIQSLENSNCDRRLLDSIRQLNDQIIQDDNIVKIGLGNIACGIMCSQFQEELPGAINAMVSSYSASVSMYVAQFPEWEQFTQRAASIELDNSDIREIEEASNDVINALEANPELADPEVPKTIRIVREFMVKPSRSAKRAAFAMIRTIENLLSSIVRHSIATLDKTAEKSADEISTAASKTISGLLAIALIGATGISSAAVQAGAPWVEQAAKVVQKQIENLSTN